MSADSVVGLVIGLALMIYLVVTLFFPERF